MYLTINSRFKPFTYEEITKPLQDYGEAYAKAEEEFSNLVTQTEAWKNIANQENSPEAYRMYEAYSSQLNQAVEEFSRGLNSKTRNQLLGLKRGYSSEIVPIVNAYNSMQEANQYRDTVRASNPNAVFAVDRYNSLDAFLNGNPADNTFINGAQLEEEAMREAYSLASSQYEEARSRGVNPTQAIRVVSGDFDDSEIQGNLLRSIGIEAYSEESRSRIESYIKSGIERGIGALVERQTLTEAQRREMDLAARRLDIEENQFAANLRMRGYNPNGTPDLTSPVWGANGITLGGNGNPQTDTVNIDSSYYVSLEGDAVTINEDDIQETEVLSYNEMNNTGNQYRKRALQKLASYYDIEFTEGYYFDKIKTANGYVYRLHIPNYEEINRPTVTSTGDSVITLPDSIVRRTSLDLR